MSVTSLVMGIISLILTLACPVLPVGLVLGIIGIIFAVMGKKSDEKNEKPTGIAVAGLVLSIVATVIGGSVFAACAICTAGTAAATNSAVEATGEAVKSLKSILDSRP